MLQRVGGERLVEKMTTMFCTNAPQKLRDAELALASLDLASGERSAHSLKSSAGQLGALRLQAVLGELEASFEKGDSAAAESLLALARQELLTALAWVSSTSAQYLNNTRANTP